MHAKLWVGLNLSNKHRFERYSKLINQIDKVLGSTVTQWLSAWLEIEGPQVRASTASLCCVIEQHLSLRSTGSTQLDPSQQDWTITILTGT